MRDMNDPLRPAEGLLIGLALGALSWVIILGIAYLLAR